MIWIFVFHFQKYLNTLFYFKIDIIPKFPIIILVITQELRQFVNKMQFKGIKSVIISFQSLKYWMYWYFEVVSISFF